MDHRVVSRHAGDADDDTNDFDDCIPILFFI
jgi:hypothetical protein